VNRNWTENIDQHNNLRLLPDEVLTSDYGDLGVTPDKRTVVYCQTHHRSAHSYMVLKHLGFTQLSGYAGAWSEWGNDVSVPIERA
jgi:thiosulfate/3-mercaptopyruvate sulfurtransferase